MASEAVIEMIKHPLYFFYTHSKVTRMLHYADCLDTESDNTIVTMETNQHTTQATAYEGHINSRPHASTEMN